MEGGFGVSLAVVLMECVTGVRSVVMVCIAGEDVGVMAIVVESSFDGVIVSLLLEGKGVADKVEVCDSIM